MITDKKDLRIVFMGNPEFAVESLRALHDGGYNVVGVVTMPDKTGGRGNKTIESDVKKYALSAGIPTILQPEKLKDPQFIEALRNLNADLFIVIAFRMLPEAVWRMPRLGTFNLHASLLPRYRGAAPLNWAVINGDPVTGVTTFFLKHELDTGDVISQESIDVGPDENVGSVHDRLMHIGARLTVETVSHIMAGDLTTIPQDMMQGEPVPAPKIFKETCHIDWNKPAQTVHNLVRGLSPYPGAWSTLSSDDGHSADIKIFCTALCGKRSSHKPGTVVREKNSMYVATADGELLEILELQAPGKRRMKAEEYLRGIRWAEAHFLE